MWALPYNNAVMFFEAEPDNPQAIEVEGVPTKPAVDAELYTLQVVDGELKWVLDEEKLSPTLLYQENRALKEQVSLLEGNVSSGVSYNEMAQAYKEGVQEA